MICMHVHCSRMVFTEAEGPQNPDVCINVGNVFQEVTSI